MNEQQDWDYQDPEDEDPDSGLSDKKKNALVRYMAILFGVAFLLVLMSFLIQLRDSRETISDLSQANNSALQNAGKLQDDNQRLNQENTALREQVEALEVQLQDAQAATERAESAHRDTLTELDGLKKSLVEQTRLTGQLEDAARAWLLGDRDECDQLLSKLDREALDDAGQSLYDQLRSALDAQTAENTEEDGEAAENAGTAGEHTGGQS